MTLLIGMLGLFLTSPAPANANGTELMRAVSTGLYHTCGLKQDGHLACWGYDGYGQVSGPNTSPDSFTQVTAGGHHSCGLKADGRLACWGYDQDGQVSGPNASLDVFTQVDAGGVHTCGLKADGRLLCWGNDLYGQVSGPNASFEAFTQVSAGLFHTCGLKASGRLACWGADWYHEVTGPQASTATFTQVDAGGYHTCGLKANGRLACWGHDLYGQVSSPSATAATFTGVSTGMYHTCGTKTSGGLACWGYDGSKQVSGPNGSSSLFSQVSGGGYHTAALKTDGMLAGWGNDEYGQLPPGSNRRPTDITLSATSLDENQPVEAEVGVLTTTDPDAGDTHTYTLVSTGSCPGPDNGSFTLSGDRLKAAVVFDYEARNSYTICVRTNDGEGGTYARQFTIAVNNLNEAPVVTVPEGQRTAAGAPLIFSTGSGNPILIDDVDTGDNSVQVTLTASPGTLTLNNTTGLTFLGESDATGASMTFTGTLAQVNAALDGIMFQPGPGSSSAATLQVTADDLGHTGLGSSLTSVKTIEITVEAAAVSYNKHRVFLPIISQSVPAAAGM